MVKEEDEVETDREIAVRGFRLKKKKENERDTSWFGRIDRREGMRDERAKSSDDGRGSSSFLFTLTFSLSLFARPRPHVRACARLNLAEVEDFQGKTCIAFYRRIDHLNNSQHRKPRPDRVLRLSLSLFLSCPFSISSLLFRSLSFSRGLALDHSKSVSLAFLLAPFLPSLVPLAIILPKDVVNVVAR